MNMATYSRTRIRRLRIAGFRSCKDVELVDLPNIVVLHGPNGAGKTSLSRAVAVVVRCLSVVLDHPPTKETPIVWAYPIAREKLLIDADDFCREQLPELRIELELELGDRAPDLLRDPSVAGDVLSVSVVMRDLGPQHGISWGFEQLKVTPVREEQQQLELTVANARTELRQAEGRLSLLESLRASGSYNESAVDEAETEMQLERDKAAATVKRVEEALQREQANPVRFRLYVARLLEIGDAYRRFIREPQQTSSKGPVISDSNGHAQSAITPAGSGLQTAILEAMLSPDPLQYRFYRSLPKLLSEAGLFGGIVTNIRPVRDDVFNEIHVRIDTPHHTEIPLDKLGTGEQQLVFLVTSIARRQAPIALVQEPEAHLYRDTQLAFAQFLLRSVEPDTGNPTLDQLWIETHHHAFAISPEYFDVSLDAEGHTKVERRKRAAAHEHFYEPGPFLDALKQLVEGPEHLERGAVVFHDGDGAPVTAGALLDSLDSDGALVKEFTEAAARTVVRLLDKATRGPTH